MSCWAPALRMETDVSPGRVGRPPARAVVSERLWARAPGPDTGRHLRGSSRRGLGRTLSHLDWWREGAACTVGGLGETASRSRARRVPIPSFHVVFTPLLYSFQPNSAVRKEPGGLALGTPGRTWGGGGQPLPGGMDLGRGVPSLLPSGPSRQWDGTRLGGGLRGTEREHLPVRPPGQRPPAPVSQDMSVHSRAPGWLRGGTQGSSAPVGGQKGEHLRECGPRSPSSRTPLTGHSGLQGP